MTDKARMLEPLPWLPILETGNEIVDRDHRQLLDDANAIQASVGRGGPWPELVALACAMRDRCIEHFATEDKILEATHFPDRDRHLRANCRVLTEINAVIVDLESAGTPSLLDWELALSLRGILIDHLLRDDLKYKSHLMHYDAPRT